MTNFGSTAMSNVNNAGSLASTSTFEENMSTLVDWLPSSNISSSLIVPSSTASLTSAAVFSSSSSSSSSSSLSFSSPSSLSLPSSPPTSLSSSISQSSTELDESTHETVVVRGARSTTTNCPSTSYHCNEDQVTDSIIENHEDAEEEDEGYASGDENSNIDDDIFIELSSISGSSDEELRYNTVDKVVGEDTGLLFGFDEDIDTMDGILVNVSNSNKTEINNITDTNDTYIVIGDSMYPSGFSLLQIIFASIAATILMIVVVVGNMLVIIAIATEKALKNIQNWFIASLAVADFFLGLIIMPFSLANEIMGYWIFGYWWCDIYSAMDVLLCTASIMNLCLISLDRYWSITKAVAYLKTRTPARAALMIALVWLLSALVCIPPLLGWKRARIEEEYPKCRLSEDIGYVLYSALGSFYIPSCIMVFVYIRIYFAAKARARRGIRKQPRPRPAVVPPESPDIRQTSFTQLTPASDSRLTPSINAMDNVATIETPQVQIPIVTCDYASDVSTSEADPAGSLAIEEKDTLKVNVSMPMQKVNLKATLSVNGGEGQSNQSGPPARCRAPSVGIDVDMVSEFDPSSSDSGVVSKCAVVKPLKLRICRPIFGKKVIGKVKKEHSNDGHHGNRDSGTPIDTKPQKPRDPEREKRRIARKKEKRATLILGLIMGSFIACWLPFFFLYIIKPLLPDLTIPGLTFTIAFWLGYMNSALNPVIYTVFNKDFRRAFRRILYK